jgi:DNA-binding response OmpR family regulator
MGRRKPIVYVVDDERVIADTLAMILSRAGFIAFAFQDAEQALIEAARATTPDLLIADVVMPGKLGTDLAIRFHESYPDCKVLLLSGQADTSNLLEAVRLQGYEFEILTKPIHPTELMARVQAFSDGR